MIELYRRQTQQTPPHHPSPHLHTTSISNDLLPCLPCILPFLLLCFCVNRTREMFFCDLDRLCSKLLTFFGVLFLKNYFSGYGVFFSITWKFWRTLCIGTRQSSRLWRVSVKKTHDIRVIESFFFQLWVLITDWSRSDYKVLSSYEVVFFTACLSWMILARFWLWDNQQVKPCWWILTEEFGFFLFF